MNVDAFPPVRSMETSGSGCGYTCCEEQILQNEKRQSPGLYGPSSSALAQQLRRSGLQCLAGNTTAKAELDQPALGASPPAGCSTCSRLQKVTESGLFPEACCFSTTQS